MWMFANVPTDLDYPKGLWMAVFPPSGCQMLFPRFHLLLPYQSATLNHAQLFVPQGHFKSIFLF